MPTHNDVPTTCTASMITGWDIDGLNSENEKERINKRLTTVNGLIRGGYKQDFAILFAITTQEQIDEYGLDEFLPLIGFEKSFVGEKGVSTGQRHKETGDLTMWCVRPKEYKEKLDALHKELTEIKERIDPPKKPDPKRQAFPDILLSHLRKNKMVVDNASVDNPLEQVLLVDSEKVHAFIKIRFGIDLKTWQNRGDAWTKMTVRSIKAAQKAWKEELV